MAAPQPVVDQALRRRFPAWTLYARAFTGSRPDAERIVREAVRDARADPAAPATEAAFHDGVLAAIRRSVLSRGRERRTELTVLDAMREDAASATARALAGAPTIARSRRRTLDLVVRRRPPLPLGAAARALGVTPEHLASEIEHAIHELARAVVPDAGTRRAAPESAHPATGSLLAYVSGALAGDEARVVSVHAESCAACGDRLGILILLKASAAATARRPLLSRAGRRLVAAAAAVVLLAGAWWAADAMWPNPWAVHATTESVPAWFHEFFYGSGREPASETSRGLALLVAGDLAGAEDVLRPVVAGTGPGPEARAEAEAYLGIARYLAGDHSRRTLRLLADGARSGRAGRLARWYLASLHLARRDPDAAREQLTALTTTRDWFGRQAEGLLAELDEADGTRMRL